jgi:hypothetical protein
MTTTTRKPGRSRPVDSRRESLLTDFEVVPLTAEDRRRAALAVCRRCDTADEARELLAALGLLDQTMLRGAA